MEINWDAIKYIFQIPKDWYVYIHRKIRNAYGTLFIRVMDGEYGGMKIDIDKQAFKDAVEEAVDLNGYVKSVDDITPDENGNVKLDGYVKSVSDIKPDEKGNVDLGANFLAPSDITTPGIVVGTDYKGENTVCSPNHKHNLKDIEGAIKTVNGNGPDQNGNVVVEAGIKTVNTIGPDETGNVDLGQLVHTVNGHAPDEEGNVQFDVVETVDGVAPVAGNVPLGAVRSINGTIRPVNGNVNLNGVFAPVDHTHPHTQISDWDDATKNFLDSLDITTPGTVVGADYADPDHPVCSPNHKHKSGDIVNDETEGFVTINTQQTVTGEKTFNNNVTVASGSSGEVIKLIAGSNSSMLLFKQGSISNIQNLLSIQGQQIAIQAGLDGGLGAGITVGDGVTLEAPQNSAQLTESPSTDGAPDLAIATVGWVKEKAITVPDGKELKTYYATIVSDVTWNGTQIIVNKRTLEFTNGVLTAVKNASPTKIDTVAYSPS